MGEKEPYYFEIPISLNTLGPIRRQKIDQRRNNIGLDGIAESMDVKFKGTTMTVKYK